MNNGKWRLGDSDDLWQKGRGDPIGERRFIAEGKDELIWT
jgi:hypothetical protein